MRLLIVLVAVAALFLYIPSLPSSVLLWSDNLAVRALLIVAVIAAASISGLLAILLFLVVSRIFLERNNRKLLDAKAVITNNSVRTDTILDENDGGEIADPYAKVDRTVHSANADGLEFMPSDEDFVSSGSGSRTVLPTTVEGSAAAKQIFGDQVVDPEISNNSAPN